MPISTAAVERAFVELIASSDLGRGVQGGVYRWDYRPAGSKAEDVCVRLASGELAQVQTGVVAVAVFYADSFDEQGNPVPDPCRGAQLEELLLLFPAQTRASAYRIEPYGSPMHAKDPQTGQHYVSAKMKFKILTQSN